MSPATRNKFLGVGAGWGKEVGDDRVLIGVRREECNRMDVVVAMMRVHCFHASWQLVATFVVSAAAASLAAADAATASAVCHRCWCCYTANRSCCLSDRLSRLASEDDQEEVQMEAEEGSGWPEDSMVM